MLAGKTAAGQALLKQTKMIYYERVYNISQKATEAMLQLMRSPSPSPTSPAGPAAAPVSPELVELSPQPGSAEGMAMPLSPEGAAKVPNKEMGKDEVLGGPEAA